ncbi:hypothetical protein RUM44_002322 [Polyplax serrata]|uniref:Uncharacterized protein n=1 Tax=Polyplax serrata TaxID=468196 RepID=A0ABR1AMI4_POLSC
MGGEMEGASANTQNVQEKGTQEESMRITRGKQRDRGGGGGVGGDDEDEKDEENGDAKDVVLIGRHGTLIRLSV